MRQDILLQTPHLILRTVTLADVENVATSWKLDEEPLSLPEAAQKITAMSAHHAQNQPGKLVHLCLAIVDRTSGAFIGWCGLDHTHPTDADPALFYALKSAYRGQGFATEAASALLKYAFTHLALASIHGGAAHENLASKRVMEKIGMAYEGIAVDGGHAFSLTREAFFAHCRST
jgi:ribosomal-protein-alanine N-acetyltransferase